MFTPFAAIADEVVLETSQQEAGAPEEFERGSKDDVTHFSDWYLPGAERVSVALPLVT